MTTIRLARPEEYAIIGEIAVDAYAEADNLPADNSYHPVLRNAAVRAAEAELLVALDGDKPVGTVTVVRPGGAYAEIAREGELEFRMLAVSPQAAGRGIGRALVRAVFERARAEQRGRVVLCVQNKAVVPRRLYESMGFRRLPGRDWSPTAGVELLGYYLDL